MKRIGLLVPLTACHICLEPLIPHPLYEKSGSMYCRNDGDFFVQKLRDQEPAVYFDEFEIKDVPLGERRAPSHTKHNGVVIQCEQNGTIYLSVKEASAALNINITSIFKHLNGERTHVGGYTFTKLDEGQVDPEALKPPAVDAYSIICVETDQVFTSVRHASTVMKIGRDIIRAVVLGYRENAYGYHFVERGTRPARWKTVTSQEKHGL
jgi:hypothetical protein